MLSGSKKFFLQIPASTADTTADTTDTIDNTADTTADTTDTADAT